MSYISTKLLAPSLPSIRVEYSELRQSNLLRRHYLHNLLGILDRIQGLESIGNSLRAILDDSSFFDMHYSEPDNDLDRLLNDLILRSERFEAGFKLECARLIKCIQSPSLLVSFESIDINRFLEDRVNMYASLFPNVQFEFSSHFNLAVPKHDASAADKEKASDEVAVHYMKLRYDVLDIVFKNLLSNAGIYAAQGDKGAKVSVDLNVQDNFLYVNVSDSGSRVHDPRSLFQKGTRDLSRKGSGFGLAGSRELLQSVEGAHLEYMEDPTKTFQLRMPINFNTQIEYHHITPSSEAPIMILIDDGSIQRRMYRHMLIKNLLTDFPDLEYAILSDTGRADDVIRRYGNRVHILISDNQMSVLNSVEGREYVHVQKGAVSPVCMRKVITGSPMTEASTRTGRRLSVEEKLPNLGGLLSECKSYLSALKLQAFVPADVSAANQDMNSPLNNIEM